MCGHLLACRLPRHGVLEDEGAGWRAARCRRDMGRRAAPRSRRRSDVVFTMVGVPDDVRAGDPRLRRRAGRSRAGRRPRRHDHERARLSLSRSRRRLPTHGVHSLDAPVSGGDVGARNGTLSIMVGGDEGAYDAVLPVPADDGEHSSSTTAATAPGSTPSSSTRRSSPAPSSPSARHSLYAHRAGLDLERVLRSVSGGAAGSWSLVEPGAAHARWRRRAWLPASTTSSRTCRSRWPKLAACSWRCPALRSPSSSMSRCKRRDEDVTEPRPSSTPWRRSPASTGAPAHDSA